MAKADEWRKCLKHLFAGPSPAMSPLGEFLANFEPGDGYDLNPGLLKFGLAIHDMDDEDHSVCRCLVVPAMSDRVAERFEGTRWAGGKYWDAIRSAPGSIVIRERGGARWPIGNVSMMVVFVDLDAWRAWCDAHVPVVAGDEVAAKMLRSFVERFERLEEERIGIAEDQKEVLAEAKASGFDTKQLRAVIRRRKMDPDEKANGDAILALYESTLEGCDDGE